MGLLIFSCRKQQLIRRKSELEARLLNLSQKVEDLQKYASLVGSGPVSLNSLMNVPTSLFGRMTSFMTMSNRMAMSQAQREFQYTMMLPGAAQNLQMYSQGNPQMEAYTKRMMMSAYYQNAMKNASERESQLLNAQEEKIQSEKAQMEAQLKMVNAEMESVDQAEGKAATALAPKFG